MTSKQDIFQKVKQRQMTQRTNKIKKSSDLPSKTIEARKKQKDILRAISNNKNVQPKNLYPVILYFKKEIKIKKI